MGVGEIIPFPVLKINFALLDKSGKHFETGAFLISGKNNSFSYFEINFEIIEKNEEHF